MKILILVLFFQKTLKSWSYFFGKTVCFRCHFFVTLQCEIIKKIYMYIKRLIDNELLIWKNAKKHKPLLLRGARQSNDRQNFDRYTGQAVL